VRQIWGTVTELVQRPGAQREGYSEAMVQIDDCDGRGSGSDSDSDASNGAPEKAVCYPQLTGAVQVGERVLLNTTAVDLDLGTGGVHFVVARASDDSKGAQLNEAMQPEAGHLMKLRYTPHQLNVLSVEAQESPYHTIMENRDSLEGVPVVCCGLHSQVPLVAAAIKKAVPTLVVGYVMDDAAALATSLSKILADSVEAGLIDVTVSTGQAFGGQIEAINLHSGLLAAVHVGGCDVVIASIGPGLAGTGTPFGHGGVAQGEAINAAATLGGAPIACLRMSEADTRDRHLGISHHSLTALSRVALAPSIIAIPHMDDSCPVFDRVNDELDQLPNQVGHTAFQLEELFYDEAALRGVKVITMGRDYDRDPLFFEAASAAGATAAMVAVMTIEDEAAAAVEKAESNIAAATAAAGCSSATASGCSASPSSIGASAASGAVSGTAATAAANTDTAAEHTCKGASNCASPCDNSS